MTHEFQYPSLPEEKAVVMTPRLDRILLWIEALESDRYSQAHYTLTKRGADCCLGVACKVAVHNGLAVKVETDLDGYTTYDGVENLLPNSVVEWYGFRDSNPDLLTDMGEVSAASLNDSYEWTFSQIAEAVRKTYGLLPRQSDAL